MRFTIYFLAAFLAVQPAMADIQVKTKTPASLAKYVIEFDDTQSVNDLSDEFRTCPNMTVIFTQSTAAAVSLYTTAPDEADPEGNGTLIKAFTGSSRVDFEPTQNWARFVVDTVETNPNVKSSAEVFCSNTLARGGGGVLTGTVDEMYALSDAGNASEDTPFWASDDADGDCADEATDPGYTLCGWTGSAWQPTGQAGVGDNWGSTHTAADDVDMGGLYDINDLVDLNMTGDIIGAADIDASTGTIDVFDSGDISGTIGTGDLDADGNDITMGAGTLYMEQGDIVDPGKVGSIYYADDPDAAVAAINAACTADSLQYGATVVIGSDGALTSPPLTVPDSCQGLTLAGTGKGTTMTYDGTGGVVGLLINNSNFVTVKNLRIEDTGTADADSVGVHVYSSSGVRLDNLQIYGASETSFGTGVLLEGSQSGSMDNLLVQYWDKGVDCIETDTADGITCNQTSITNSRFTSIDGPWFTTTELDGGVVISHSTLEGGTGIKCDSSSGRFEGIANHYEPEGDEYAVYINGSSSCAMNFVGGGVHGSRTVEDVYRAAGSGAAQISFTNFAFQEGIDNQSTACINVFAPTRPAGIQDSPAGTAIADDYLSGEICGAGVMNGAEAAISGTPGSLTLFGNAVRLPPEATHSGNCSTYVEGGVLCRDSSEDLYLGDGTTANLIPTVASDATWAGAHDFSSATAVLPTQATTCAETDEGSVCWDADSDVLYIGNNGDQTAIGSSGTDADAIHDNVASEISALSLVTVASGDHILIEDADDSNNKKRIAASDLLSGGGDITTDDAWVAAGDLIVADAENSAVILTKGSDTEVLTMVSGDVAWAAAPSGGAAITFDIGDDAGDDSVDVNEIATTGDTNSIFTEPSADKILIDLTNNWPTADLAVTVTTNANLTGDVTSSGNATTIADSVTVTGWVMGASTATTPSINDDDTSLATTEFVQDETVATGDISGSIGAGLTIVADAVELSMMAGGTDGQIITYDASGDPVAVGPGTATQVLTSNGAGAAPSFEDAPTGLFTDSTGEIHPTTTTNDVCNDSSCSTWRIQDTGESQFTSVTVPPPASTSGSLVILEGTDYGSNTYTFRGLDAGWTNDIEIVWPDDNAPTDTEILGIASVSAGVITLEWEADDTAGGTNALLDGSVHSDTAAQGVTRGSLIYGNATPAWDELTIGGSGSVLTSDGTDASWDTTPNLGTPSAVVLTNATGTASGLTAGNASNAALLDSIDSTGFAILAGQSGGQTLIGGTGSGDDLTLETTSNGTKGSYIFAEDSSGTLISCDSDSEKLEIDASGILTCGSIPAGSFDSTTVDATTWSDGANATNAWTFDISGTTDPVLTAGDGVLNVTTGTLQIAGSTVVSAADLGTGVPVALATNVGSAGAFVTLNGALGTPSSGNGSNLTSVDAATGDSATAFFDAGAIEAARGGTAIDSSGSTGVAVVSSGTWSIDSTPDLGTPSALVVNTSNTTGSLNLGAGTIQGSVAPIITTDGTETAVMYGEAYQADHGTPTSDTTYTLPDAVAGMNGCFYDYGGGAGTIILSPASGDTIILDGTAETADETVVSPGADGDFICLYSWVDNFWWTMGRSGAWDGGTD